jgi:multidrug efflux pump subunit AcrA (membrane-fusion protein)
MRKLIREDNRDRGVRCPLARAVGDFVRIAGKIAHTRARFDFHTPIWDLRPVQLRSRALERRKLPEELDQLSGLARPWTSLGVGGLAIAVAALVIWGFAGKIPRTVNAPGVLAVPGGLAIVDSTLSGPVSSVLVSQDSEVQEGQPVAVIGPGNGTKITAPFTGRVIDLEVIIGQVVAPGVPLFTLQRAVPSAKDTSVYLFVASKDGAGLAPGMSVNVTVANAPSAAFGVVRGKIARVSETPLSTAGVSALVANPNLAQVLTKNGPPLLAQVTLKPDAATVSGFAWSTPKGAPFPLEPGTQVTAQVTESQQRPVDVIFGT